MTKQEVIQALKEGHKVRYKLFSNDEYTDRLYAKAIFNERNRMRELKHLKEKEYQKELAKLNKKYGKS